MSRSRSAFSSCAFLTDLLLATDIVENEVNQNERLLRRLLGDIDEIIVDQEQYETTPPYYGKCRI